MGAVPTRFSPCACLRHRATYVDKQTQGGFLFFLVICCGLALAQASQTIYSNGTAYLPEQCPSGAIAVLTVSLTWKDVEVAEGGTGRKIVEEATFTGGEGIKEIRFTGVRITPSFPRGEISIDLKCEFKKGEVVVKKFKVDKDDKNNPKPVKYEEAISGKLMNLKVTLKPVD